VDFFSIQPAALNHQYSTSKCHYPYQRDACFLLVVGCQPTVMHDAYLMLNMNTTDVYTVMYVFSR